MLDQATNRKDSEMLILESENKIPLNFEAGNPFISDKRVKLSRLGGREQLEFIHPEKIPYTYNGEVLDKGLPDIVETIFHQLTKFPNNPYVLNNLGLALLRQNKWNQAQKKFEKAIEIKKDFYSAKMNLARTLTNRGKLREALAVYKEMEKIYTGDVKVFMGVAHIYFLQRKLNGAETLLSKVISLDQNNATAYNNRALTYLVKGGLNKAISDLRKAISINTYFATAENNLGVCYVLQGIPRKAVKHFMTALSIDANCGDAAQNLALCFHRSKEYQKAIVLLERYLKRNQSDISARELLAKSYLMIKKYGICHKELSVAFKLAKMKYADKTDYDFSHFYNNFGVIYHQQKDFTKAREYYLRAKSESVSPSEVLYRNIINLYFDTNKINLVKSELEEALEWFADNSSLLFLYSRYCFYVQDTEGAINTLKKIIEKEPSFTSAYGFLSFIYSEVFLNYDLAIETLNKGLNYTKKSPVLINNLAYNFLMKNDVKKAKANLDIVKDIKGNVFLTATKGLLLLREGNVQEGTSLYNKAAFLVHDNPVLHGEVEQKKNLELAKFYYNRGRKRDSSKYIQRLLASKLKSSVYYAQGEKFAKLINLFKN